MSDDDGGGMVGKLLKWGILLFLFGIFPPLFFVWIGWKYVKMCVLFYFKMLYLIIRFPIWLFIQLPLYYIGVGVHTISNAFSKAYGVMVAKKKRYGLLFGILLLFTIRTFLPHNTDAMVSFLTSATLILPLVFFIPFFFTFLVAAISAHFRMPDIARKEMPGGMNTGMKRRTGQAASAAASAGAMGVKAYKNKEEIKAAKGTAEDLASGAMDTAEAAAGEGALAGDMVSVLEGMPMLGTMVEGGGVAAGSAATIAGMTGGTAILAFIAVFILGIIGFIIISAILSVFLYGTLIWLTGFLGPVIGPILGALGLGQAYGNWIGQTLSNRFLPQINLAPETRVVQQAGAKIGCFLQGPSCLRQWRLNHTTRPGSEDVGEKYKLKINNFDVGGQAGIDVAYKQKKYNIPVSFLLLNTRHGLKGIPARHVSYRVRIIDAKRKGEKAYCSTGWKDAETSYSNGNILPGTSFSPRITSLDDLTLKKCGMLQPALGHQFTGKLDVKYDYSSQSTLYVKAMSRKNMRDKKITPAFKKSKTADTPVETYINVKAPVTYVDGENRATPFTVRVGTATDRYDVEYTVHADELKMVDSSKTEMVGGSSCIGLQSTSKPNEFKLSKKAQNRITRRVKSERQGDLNTDLKSWFDKAKNPSPARCTFKLSSPGSISPTGETLTFRVDANYTVNIEKTSDPFEVKNTHCSQFECPILFHLTQNEFQRMTTRDDFELPPQKWRNPYSDNPKLTKNFKPWRYAVCNGIDAGNGCSATDNYQTSYDRTTEIAGGIEEGEIAVAWNSDTAQTNNIFSCRLAHNPDEINKSSVGIEPDKLREVVTTDNSGEVTDWKRLHYDGEDFRVIEYKYTYSDSSGIPGVIEKQVTWTFKAGSCKNGKNGWGPEFKLVKTEGEYTGAIPWTGDKAGDLIGTLGGAISDAALGAADISGDIATGAAEGAVYFAKDQTSIEGPSESETPN